MISIIVPVYNAEKYLPQCLDSLVGQTYTNIEIILVNDCSLDNSLQICEMYAKNDSRIKIVDKSQNEGLGEARKSGVSLATGEWICYVDSDDWLELDALETLQPFIQEYADIIVFGLAMCHENKDGEVQWRDIVYPDNLVAETKQQIGDLMTYLDSNRVFPFMCNKVYNMEFVRKSQVVFNSIKSMEDFFYNIEIFEKANKILTVNRALYNYRKTGNETLATAYNSEFFELSECRYMAEKKFLENVDAATEKNMQRIYQIHLKHVISCLMRDAAPNAHLKHREKIFNAKRYLSSVTTMEVLDAYKASNLKMKVLRWVLISKKYLLAVLVGSVVFFVQNDVKKLFCKFLK